MLITETQRKQLTEIASKHGLELILAFGSVVKNSTHAKSDLDIAILPQNRNATLFQDFSLHREISKVFKPEFQTVDLAYINRADPLFLHQIASSYQVLFGSPETEMGFNLFAFHRYEDYKPYLALEEQAVKNYAAKQSYAH